MVQGPRSSLMRDAKSGSISLVKVGNDFKSRFVTNLRPIFDKEIPKFD